MKETKKIFTISKDSGYGYIDEVRFITHIHPQGGVEYYLEARERWADGHFTYPSHHYLNLTNRKEYGNELYKQYLAEGYKLTDRWTFEPMQMDMR